MAVTSSADVIEDAAIDCTSCAGWNQPQQPFRVFGNTWYVGTAGLSSILVVTDDGLILLDGALPQSAHLIDENIRRLGYDSANIRFIGNSHAHFDHAGGIAALQRRSGAQVLASTGSIEALRSGALQAADPQFAFGPEGTGFPAVANVELIGDGKTIELGGVVLTAHYTPGHTPGGTTWTWQSCEGDRCLNMVYADSLSPVSADGFRFSGSGGAPSAGNQIVASAKLIAALDCDVLLSPHPNMFHMAERFKSLEANPETQPFVDPGACKAYAQYFTDWLARRLAEEGQGQAK